MNGTRRPIHIAASVATAIHAAPFQLIVRLLGFLVLTGEVKVNVMVERERLDSFCVFATDEVADMFDVPLIQPEGVQVC